MREKKKSQRGSRGEKIVGKYMLPCNVEKNILPAMFGQYSTHTFVTMVSIVLYVQNVRFYVVLLCKKGKKTFGNILFILFRQCCMGFYHTGCLINYLKSLKFNILFSYTLTKVIIKYYHIRYIFTCILKEKV